VVEISERKIYDMLTCGIELEDAKRGGKKTAQIELNTNNARRIRSCPSEKMPRVLIVKDYIELMDIYAPYNP
jgi:hypothetical protein